MACFHPLQAWQSLQGGSLSFVEIKDSRSLTVPCGQCIGCRLQRSLDWAVRIMHESSLYEYNSFVTLTYDDSKLLSPSLIYRDFQLFMKRLRFSRQGLGVRFYMCGEYGDNFGRPHFHACLFGVFFEDRELFKDLPSGHKLYTSKELDALWGKGFCSIGDVTFESAAYVARYVMKKVTGKPADEHYRYVDSDTGEVCQRVPEFCRMSLKPGIGADWFGKYGRDVFPADSVVIGNREVKPPRYYDKLLERSAEFGNVLRMDVECGRIERAMRTEADCTAARLAVREKVVKSRLSLSKRSL